jgi:hypothetical protein
MLHLDPDRETPGRQVVRHFGQSLVTARNGHTGGEA